MVKISVDLKMIGRKFRERIKVLDCAWGFHMGFH